MRLFEINSRTFILALIWSFALPTLVFSEEKALEELNKIETQDPSEFPETVQLDAEEAKTVLQEDPEFFKSWAPDFEGDEVRIVRSKKALHRIPGLAEKEKYFPIFFEGTGKNVKVYTKIQGSYTQSGWNLLQGQAPIAGEEVGQEAFEIKIELTDRVTKVPFQAITPKGGVKTEYWGLVYTEWNEVQEILARGKKKDPRKNYLFASLGTSSITYRESGVSDFNMLALTAKVAYTRPIFGPNWELGGNIFFNALPLSTNQDNVTVRFFGINARLGYVFPFIKKPWRLRVSGGFYFNAMLINSNAFGYTPLLFPQLYPVLERQIDNKNFLYFYLKYVPMAKGFSLFKFGEREIASGLGWIHFLPNRHPIHVGVDVSSMNFNIAGTNPAIPARITTISLSVGYGFEL